MDEKERGGRITRGAFVAGTATSVVVLRHGTPAAAAPAVLEPSHAMLQTVTLEVNGAARTLTLESRVTLLDALRDRLGMTGTKKGCDQGTCGACTVLVNDRRINACLTLAVMHAGDRVMTIEGLAPAGALHPLQRAFIEHDAFQCGYCTPGQIVSSVGMAGEGHAFDRDTVREQMSGNICRCGCYPHIVDAIVDWQGRA